MGSKLEKEKAVDEELGRRGGMCVLCTTPARDTEIQWHHVIMLFDERGKPELDANGNVLFDREAEIATMVSTPNYSVSDVKAELAKCIPLCKPCHLDKVHGHKHRRGPARTFPADHADMNMAR